MGEPKPLASLTSGLLARKGQAAPAMRRQSMMIATPEAGAAGHNNPLEDLGWNDMGDEQSPMRQSTGLSPMPASAPAPATPLMPVPMYKEQAIRAVPPVVVRQQEELARELTRPIEPEAEEAEVEAEAFEPEPAPLFTPVVEPVAERSVSAPVAAVSEPRKPVVRAAPGSRGKAAFTLRLDGDRHLKLRLVCAINHRSAQQIVTQALDEFLAKQPSVGELMASSGGVN